MTWENPKIITDASYSRTYSLDVNESVTVTERRKIKNFTGLLLSRKQNKTKLNIFVIY